MKKKKIEDKLIEEMSELTFAILKYRKNKSKERLDNIKQEIEDVQESLNKLKSKINNETKI